MVNANEYSKWYDVFSSSESIYDMFQHSAKKYSTNNLFYVERCGQIKTITYRQCEEYINLFSCTLIKEGITNKNVAIIGRFSVEWFIVFFSLMKTFNTVVPMRDNITKEELRANIDALDIACIICDDAVEKLCTDEACTVLFFSATTASYDLNRTYLSYKVHRKSEAMLVLTSGTTTYNKAVILSHHNIISDTMHIITTFGYDSFSCNDRVLSFLPPWHMFQIMAGMMIELYYGASICLCQNLFEAFTILNPDILVAVPEIVNGLWKRICKTSVNNKLLCELKPERMKKMDLSHVVGNNLQTIISGGAFIDPEIVFSFEKIGISILNAYGLTECSPFVTANTKANKITGSVGRVNTSNYCQIAIENQEILVRGDIVFEGYYRDNKTTSRALVNGWFHTGDLGYIDDNGYLFITGRKKNLIILSNGNNISPEYIEMILKAQDGIVDALVYAKHYGKAVLLCADVVLNHEARKDKDIVEQILKSTNTQLPLYSHLHIINIVEKQFPKNGLGKTIRYQMNMDGTKV